MTGAVFHALCRRIIGGPFEFALWLQKGASNLLTNILLHNDGFGSLFFLDERNPLSMTSPLFGKNKVCCVCVSFLLHRL